MKSLQGALLVLIINIYFIFGYNPVLGQNSYLIKGQLIDTENVPVEWATVLAFVDKDSSNVFHGISEEGGYFTLPLQSEGLYTFAVTYLGEKRHSRELIVDGEVDLGKIVVNNSVMLSDIEVTARRPEVKYENGKLTFVVKGKIVKSNALELIKTVPLVFADKDNNLLLKGSTAKVLINNQDLKLSGEALKTYLRTLAPEDIKEIEVITNPSAAYDASGSLGLINIITHNKTRGWSGSVYTEGSYRRFLTNRAGGNFSYYTSKFGISAGLRRSDYKSFNDLKVDRVPHENSVENTFSETSAFINDGVLFRGDLTVNYFINESNKVGAFIRQYDDGVIDEIDGASGFINNPNLVSTSFRGESDVDEKNTSYGINSFHSLDTFGRTLNLEYLFVNVDKSNIAMQSTSFFINQTLDNVFQLTNPSIQDYIVHSAKADFNIPFSKFKLQLGLKYSDVVSKNDLRFKFAPEDSVYVFIPLLDNIYQYDENVYAGYISGSKQWKSMTFQTGLRLEYTDYLISLIDEENVESQTYDDYLDFFPNLGFTYSTESGSNFSLSYSRRLNRPSYRDFNPSIVYATQYLYTRGNPFLTPEYSNNIELGIQYKSYIISGFANFTKSVIGDYIIQNNDNQTTIVQKENLNSSNIFGGLISTSYEISKDINFQTSVLTQWQQNELNVDGEILKASNFKLNLNGSLDYSITDQLAANWSFYYTSPFIYGLYEIKGQFINNVNLVYSLDRFRLGIGMEDVFRTGRWDSNFTTPTSETRWLNKWPTGILNVSLSYRFGGTDAGKKGTYSGEKSSDASDRI